MKKFLMTVMTIVLLCSSIVTNVYATQSVKGSMILSDYQSGNYIFEDDLLKKVLINDKEVVENQFSNYIRTSKKGIENCTFVYDENKNIISELRDGISILYLYEQDDKFDYLNLIGFIYEESEYYYTRDVMNRIDGIADDKFNLIAKYEYDDNSNKVNAVLKKEENCWKYCNDYHFIGNINRIRNICAYYDVESDLYYENGVFFDAVTNKVINNSKIDNEISLMSWGDDLDYTIYCWQHSLLSDEWFNSAAPYSNDWYIGLSDVEVIARTIYGENTRVTIDQDAIAWVIRNRAYDSDMSVRDVVLADWQFSAAGVPNNPSYNTIKAQNSNDLGWSNAVYMACLLCTTLNEYDWNAIGVIPEGMSNQTSYRAWYLYDNFASSGPMNYAGDDVYNVYIAGYGSINSYDELNAIIGDYEDRNIFFRYY